MPSTRGLAFSVAGVSVGIFGLSLSLMPPNPGAFPVFGSLVAAIGMIISLTTAASIRE